MVFTSKHKMEMTKSEKLFKKNEKQVFEDFFRYDVIQERAWFRAFLTPIFIYLFFKNSFQAVRKSDSKNFKSI